MKFLDYLFWRLRRSEKLTGSSYSTATFVLGVIVTLIILIVFDIPYKLVHQKNRLYDYILWFILASIFSLPFRLIFPKKKIENLNFTEEELKKYKIIFRCIMMLLLLLYIIRVWYCW